MVNNKILQFLNFLRNNFSFVLIGQDNILIIIFLENTVINRFMKSFLQLKEPFNLDGVDFCVKVYSDWRNSTDAADKCQSDGAHLITLDTTEKLLALSTFVPQNSMLI